MPSTRAEARRSEEFRNELLRAVKRLGADSFAVFPEDVGVEFLTPQSNNSANSSGIFTANLEYYDKLISRAILGGTLTSQSDGKSSTNALGNVHNEVRSEIRQADALSLANTIQAQLVPPLIALNFDSEVRAPHFSFDLLEIPDRKALIESLTGAVSLGLKIPQSFAHEALRFPEAKEGEEVLVLSQPLKAVGGESEGEDEDAQTSTKAQTQGFTRSVKTGLTPDQGGVKAGLTGDSGQTQTLAVLAASNSAPSDSSPSDAEDPESTPPEGKPDTLDEWTDLLLGDDPETWPLTATKAERERLGEALLASNLKGRVDLEGGE